MLFICNFNITLAASGALEVGAEFQYLHTLAYMEALRTFELLYDYVEITEILNVDYILRCLAQ